MRIIKNQTIYQRQTDNVIRAELSNVASAVQTQSVLVDYYQVDPDRTTLLNGLRNAEDYIGPTSTVVYKHIAQVPLMGIDNLTSMTGFDEELGFEENFSQSGATYPNTIIPKPYDCFMIPDSPVKALYMITNVTPTTVRSNPFTEIQFNLYTRNPEIIQHLLDQVKDEYVTTVTAIGLDKSLVIKKENYFKLQDHVENYIQLAELYQYLFYSQQKSAFVFDGLPGVTGGTCLGYQSKEDVNGLFQSLEISDPDNPYYEMFQQIEPIKNGDIINDEGDHLYIIDGEPIVVSNSYPYWLVRNHTDSYGNANDFPGAEFGPCAECNCSTCFNANCPNNGGNGLSTPEMEEYLKTHADSDGVFRQVFIDITLWKLLFSEGIVVYDDVVTFANNNYTQTVPRLYIDSPDLYLEENLYKRSVLYRMVKRLKNPFQYIHPHSSEADPRIAKFQGKHIYYLDYYNTCRDCRLNCGFYNVWDEEFQCRIKNCKLYPVEEERVSLCGIPGQCEVARRYPFNTALRNAIILGYNNKPIDWENLTIESEINIDNYILIPILMSYYKEYIRQLEK